MAQHVPKHRLLRFGGGSLLILALLAVLGAAARATVPHPRLKRDQYKQQVEKLETVWRDAQLNGDVAAMDRLLSEDYVGISMTGQVVTKTQQLDRTRSRQLVLTKIELDDVKVKLIGTTAIVTSLAQVEGSNEGSSVQGTYRYTRVYTRLPSGAWKITNFEATRVPTGSPAVGKGPPGENRTD